jgi:hypothetical protein
MARTPRNDWLDRPILCDETGPFKTVHQVHVAWCAQLRALQRLVAKEAAYEMPWVIKMLQCASRGGNRCRQTWFCPRCWTGRAVRFANAMLPHRPYFIRASVFGTNDDMTSDDARDELYAQLRRRLDKRRGDRVSTIVYACEPDKLGCQLTGTLFMKGRVERTLVELAAALHYPEALLTMPPERLLAVREFTRGQHSHANFGNHRKGLVHDL